MRIYSTQSDSLQIDRALTGNRFRTDLQGLRAIAVLAVIACHMNASWLPGGYLGVDIFFVISGFVVTQSIISGSDQINFKHFYGSRIRRILPAYMLMLSIVAMGSAILLLPADFSIFGRSFVYASTFFSNFYFANYGGYFSPQAEQLPLLHTWSLAVEMQFYLALPAVLHWTSKKHYKTIFIIAIIATFTFSIILENTSNKQWLYYSPLSRASELLMGGLLALHRKKYQKNRWKGFLSWLGVACIASSFIFLEGKNHSILTAMLACIGAAAIIMDENTTSFTKKILACKPFQHVGNLSYSLYLWHWPLLAWIRYFEPKWIWNTSSIALYLTSIYILGLASWRYIEKPLRNSKESRHNSFKKWSGLIAACLSISAISPTVNAAIPSPPIPLTRYADPDEICHGKINNICNRGAQKGHPILLIGDSHAAQLNFAMDVAGKESATTITLISASNCIPISTFNYLKLPPSMQDDCKSQINEVSKIIEKFEILVLAGKWSYQIKDIGFPKELNAFLTEKGNAKKKIYVLEDTLQLSNNPLKIQRLKHIGLPAPIQKINNNNNDAEIIIKETAQENANAKWINTSLAQKTAFENININNVYFDENHLNEEGSRLYGKALVKTIHLIASGE